MSYDEEFETKNNSYILLTYEIEDKNKNLTEEGSIEMSNYSVPFDFKDNIFLFLEHNPNEKRDISIYEFKESNKENKKKVLTTLNKNFGHISFLKILNKNLLLLVRNYNQIEIYNIENEFKKISSYNNNYEINDIGFYEIKNNEDEKEENDTNDKRQYNIIFIDVEQNICEFKFKNELNNKLEKAFNINVKDINGISNELKNKGLFDLDFPYYIKNSPNFIAITTDQACFLFRKEK